MQQDYDERIIKIKEEHEERLRKEKK